VIDRFDPRQKESRSGGPAAKVLAVEGYHELAPAAPRVLRFDVRSPAFKQDPLPTLARMREAGPVIRVRLPLVGTAWMATTYDAVTELLSDHHRFVQSPAAAGNRWLAICSCGCYRGRSVP
jgi:cytochrome P450